MLQSSQFQQSLASFSFQKESIIQSKDSPQKLSLQQKRIQQKQNRQKREQIKYDQFEQIFRAIVQSGNVKGNNIEATICLCKAIQQYSSMLIKYQDDDLFYQHSVQNKFIALLLKKLMQFNFTSDVVRAVFSSLEVLLGAIKKQDQYVYILVCINRQGFISANYKFEQQQDSAYYEHFLRLLIIKINQDTKYLSIFFNTKQPQFPLLLQLLKLSESTTIKLALMKICANPFKPIQTFIANFPFILFYPIYTYRVYYSIRNLIQKQGNMDQVQLENIQSTLKFMEDFIEKMDRYAVDIYTNTFITLIGRLIFKQLKQLNPKNANQVCKLLKVLLSVVIKTVQILKIRTGLIQLLSPLIPKRVLQFLQQKTFHLDQTYCLMLDYPIDIHNHCQKIYNQTSPRPSLTSSFLKVVNSYIPRSRDNWFYHQVKKLSDIIGFDLNINQRIKTDKYRNKSYLAAVQMDQQQYVRNQIFYKILKYDNEEILFYYLKLINQLRISLEPTSVISYKQGEIVFSQTSAVQCQKNILYQLLHVLSQTISLCLIKSLYSILLSCEIKLDQIQNPLIKQIYESTIQKLIYFILTQGWVSFINRTKNIYAQNQDHQQFDQDMFRDLQCQILFFVTVRHLLGTNNSQAQLDQQNFQTKDFKTQSINTTCLLILQHDQINYSHQDISLILDAQYIRLQNNRDQSICKGNIQLNKCQIYQDQARKTIQILERQNPYSTKLPRYYLIKFLEKPIFDYICKQLSWRRQICMEIDLKLRLMCFPLKVHMASQEKHIHQ